MNTVSWEYWWPSYIPEDNWWPSYIPEDKRRAWVSPAAMGKWFKVDGILPVSYIYRVERLGKPIKYKRRTNSGAKLYRPLDLLARARGEGKKVEQSTRLHDKQLMGELTLKRSHLEKEIEQLEQRITHLEQGIAHFVESSTLSKTLTDKHMVSEQTIVEQGVPFADKCGVYFLVRDNRVVYVGQSIHISVRLLDHAKYRDFDSYAFIRCPKDKLDILESLYIHALAPEDQGRSSYGASDRIAAPCSFAQILVMGAKNGNK